MTQCPKVGEHGCNFSRGSVCTKLKWEGDVFAGALVKPCEVCDKVAEYWVDRKARDKIRRLKRIAEGAKY